MWGVEGRQVGSMNEEPQVRGWYNITFICTPTNQETVSVRLSPVMKTWTPATSVNKTTCLCRDTGGKGTLPAQHTSFNTLDNWGHKTPTQSKRKRTGKKGLKGHGPEHVYNTLGYIIAKFFLFCFDDSIIISVLHVDDSDGVLYVRRQPDAPTVLVYSLGLLWDTSVLKNVQCFTEGNVKFHIYVWERLFGVFPHSRTIWAGSFFIFTAVDLYKTLKQLHCKEGRHHLLEAASFFCSPCRPCDSCPMPSLQLHWEICPVSLDIH